MSPPPSIHDAEFDDIEIKEEIVDMDSTAYEELPVLDESSSRLECNNEVVEQQSIMIKESAEEIQMPLLDQNHNHFSKSIKTSPQIQYINAGIIDFLSFFYLF